MKFNIIVAVDKNRGIGKNNTLPWHLPGDLKHFKQLTSQSGAGKINAVIMGRKTWNSLPAKVRPLPGRLNIIMSRQNNLEIPANCHQARSLDEALSLCNSLEIEEVFVLGGAALYSASLVHEDLKRVYLTQIQAEFDCDCFFPDYSTRLVAISASAVQTDNGIDYSFQILEPALMQNTKQESWLKSV